MMIETPTPSDNPVRRARPPGPPAGISKRALLQALHQNVKWVEKKRDARGRAGDPWIAENIVIGCAQTLEQCGQPIHAWLGRKNRRSQLRRVRDTYHTPAGSRALRRPSDGMPFCGLRSALWPTWVSRPTAASSRPAGSWIAWAWPNSLPRRLFTICPRHRPEERSWMPCRPISIPG